jgi:hypothetical protein
MNWMCRFTVAAALAVSAWGAAAQNNAAQTAAAVPANTAEAARPQPRTAAKAAFAFKKAESRLQPGATEGPLSLLLEVTGANLPTTGLVATDAKVPAVSKSALSAWKADLLSGDAERQVWHLTAEVKTYQVAGEEQRVLSVRHGTASDSLSYTITNAFPSEFSWKVSAPGAGNMAWNPDTGIPVKLLVDGPVPAEGVGLLSATLIEATHLDPLPLMLCGAPTKRCDLPTRFEPGRPYDLFLRPVGSLEPQPGKYSGTVSLVAHKGDTKDVQVVLNVTSARARWLGFGALLLGAVLAWLVTVWGRSAGERRRRQLAAALLRERLTSLQLRLHAFPGGKLVGNTRNALMLIGQRIDGSANLVPAGIPSLWGADAAQGTSLVSEMNAIAARLDVLAIVIDEGFAPLAALGIDNPKVKTAVLAVDEQAVAQDVKPDAVRDAVKAAVREAKPAPKAGDEEGLFGGAAAGAGPLPSPGRLRFEMDLLSGFSWLVILAATVLGGALLFLRAQDFGRWDDLLECLLWGFGVPVASGQIASLTPGGVRSSFGVTAPS